MNTLGGRTLRNNKSQKISNLRLIQHGVNKIVESDGDDVLPLNL